MGKHRIRRRWSFPPFHGPPTPFIHHEDDADDDDKRPLLPPSVDADGFSPESGTPGPSSDSQPLRNDLRDDLDDNPREEQ